MAQFLFLNRGRSSSVFLTRATWKPLKIDSFCSISRVFRKTLYSIGCSCLLLMPPHAHSISAGRPAAPDTAPFPVLHGLLELAKGIAIRCFCLGDFSPHDSGLSSGAARRNEPSPNKISFARHSSLTDLTQRSA